MSDSLQVKNTNQLVSQSVMLLTGSESLEESFPVEIYTQLMHIHE